MATELSQAEVLDFLCQAGGRAANAALLGHFKGFLRDPEASPAELRRRRELFKGFVNSVATVKQEGPDAPKDVVLRKRYRELVGEEPRKAPDAQAESEPTGARVCRREPPGEGPPSGMAAATTARGLGGRCEALPWPPCPRACPAEAPRARAIGQAKPRDLRAKEPPPPPNGLHLPVGEMGATLGSDSPRQRIRAWVATHQAPSPDPTVGQEEDEPRPARRSPPPGSAESSACPLLPPLFPPTAPVAWDPPVPVFRSIRCQLSLQDLEDFIEQESDGSSDGHSGGSDSSRLDGETGVLRRLLRRSKRRSVKPTGGAWSGAEGTPGKEGAPQRNGAIPDPHALLSRIAVRAFPSWGKEAEKPSKGLAKPKKGATLPPPSLDAPLSPRPAPRQGPVATSTLAVEKLGLDTDCPPEPRSGLVPLEHREHTWLVKVATGSWMQAWALLLEDPHLAIHKDFISGYTVLHWLAKHGNAQVLLDIVAGAEKAGVAVDVNVKSGSGYTPLHLAAMHGHPLVMKALVQKLHCRVQIRDSSGKRPWQYLSSATSGEVWQLLGAPRGKTIFPARPIARNSSPPPRKGKSPELARKISRKASLAAYLKHQHTKWKMANKYPPLHEREEYSD